MGFCFCWVSSPSGASVVWGGWDTNTPSFSLPAQQKGARRGEGLPHIDFGAACTTHTPHPCLIFFYSQVKRIPDYASFARSRAENELWLPGSQIGSDDPNGSPGMAVLAVMTLRWERPTAAIYQRRPMFCSMSESHWSKLRLGSVWCFYPTRFCVLSHRTPFFVISYSCMLNGREAKLGAIYTCRDFPCNRNKMEILLRQCVCQS